MREEEKLARDVYLALGARYDHRTFNNIARSEQRHVDLMGAVAEAYALPAPAALDEPGVYENPDLSALHAQLMTAADVSLVAALGVGALIEETDIADLQRALEDAPPADVADVYTRLLGASQNHLRAFVRALETEGETYVPQVLPLAEFDATLAATPTHGRGQGSGDCDGSGQGQGQGRGRGNGNGPGRGNGQGRGNGGGRGR